jgi:hypothetical protein
MFSARPQAAHASLSSMGLDPSRPYAAVHLHLGDDGPNAAFLQRSLPQALSSVQCARSLLAEATGSPSQAQVALVTDSAVLRRFVAAGYLHNTVRTRGSLACEQTQTE